ncbi:aldehyde dehydrogenase family protein [Lysobacter gummosus]|uniref:Aldehyde dehydrogenase family protein n=1 Tax=Lysobacter gummosus TaxID=262324 RepID=A0ABY3X8Q5_9GAMM|nr:aldehyde dehydrogenase family protein [Lysobacter gummosus]ALN93486.1 aldehyde dehydrogenase family protein [Lysobacter gummosus]UNP28939.1 aldehyde dehydrogenase family protein [Lysobacter gummosus]
MGAREPVLIEGRWQASRDSGGEFRAFDPTRAVAFGPAFPISGARDVEAALASASAAADQLAACEPERIADFFDAYALGIEHDAPDLVALAHLETALAIEPRLAKVELPRTTGQLRQAARAVRERSWTQPVIDTAAGLRSHLAPLHKPVLIFGPNNFPFAFNAVAGSDFASAIAARNPVIAKVHPSHPATSQRLAELAHRALVEAGLPATALQVLYHLDPALGLSLAGDARLGALAFTGSRNAGLALKAAADAAGVPAYLELSSINPVFMLDGALRERGAALAQEFFASCTMGAGQFCTNPGVVVVPRSAHGDAFVEAAAALFAQAGEGVLFSQGGRDHYQAASARWREAGATLIGGGEAASGEGYRVRPTLWSVDAEQFIADARLRGEVFGPASLIVRTRDDYHDTIAIARALEGNLTATIYAAADDAYVQGALAAQLRPRVGRLIGNRMPTGVAVSAAMNHGGPYPSTGHPGFTSVGLPAAIRRFAALHCYDQIEESLLPAELRDRNPGGIARCIDGRWTTDDIGAKP